MSAWWNKVYEIAGEVHGCKPGDTWHPLPSLCLLTEAEFDKWRRTPNRRITAIAAVNYVCKAIHAFPPHLS